MLQNTKPPGGATAQFFFPGNPIPENPDPVSPFFLQLKKKI
jgi:hypothetical protein